MKFPYECLSGELLLEDLRKNNLVTEAEYKKINKHYESNRNEDNFTLIIITEILEFIDDEKLGDVNNLIKTKGEVTSIAYCYVAI